MRKSFVAAMFLAGLSGAASAATTTLDFTSSGINAGTGYPATQDGFDFAISGVGGNVVDATHDDLTGCSGYGWEFACQDVGLGVDGLPNDNEIDNNGNGVVDAGDEYVVVSFNGLVKVLGFAGMLAYNIGFDEEVECDGDCYAKRMESLGGETVVLEYTNDGGSTWQFAGEAFALFYSNFGGPIEDDFNSVGLAFDNALEGIIANAVRFTAGGISDDKNINVTAAGLRIASVPVPASFPLLLAGIGALGFAARRKRRNAA